MNPALQKSLELLLLIGIGLLLQKRLPKKEHLAGVKAIILNVALPATIFLALLRIKLEFSLLVLPLLALAFNLILFLTVRYGAGFFFRLPNGKRKRTLSLLLPSLAPGLSCFPFIMAYMEEESLALAALADVGNKIFVLLFLYLVAMYWYRQRAAAGAIKGSGTSYGNLVRALLREPINVVIFVAFLMLLFGINLSYFPEFVQNTVSSLSVMMVSLVLIFIGMAVRINFSDFRFILKLLVWRSGAAFLFSGICLLVVPALTPAMALLLVVLPQSSCSFWPYAHMSAVSKLEDEGGQTRPSFDLNLSIAVLACSLPFSVAVIMSVFHFREAFANPLLLLLLGGAIILTGILFKLIRFLRTKRKLWILQDSIR